MTWSQRRARGATFAPSLLLNFAGTSGVVVSEIHKNESKEGTR